jgi:hypothetical protein
MLEADDLRRLLTDYHHSLALARELALKLLDAAQPDAEALALDTAAQHRRLAGDAIARIETSEDYVASLWKTYNVDRRQFGKDSPKYGDILPDRRKNPRSK